MNDQYWIIISDEQRGPYTLTQLRGMWNSGAITANTLYWQQGFEDWHPLANIIEVLEDRLPPTLPPPSIGCVFPQQQQSHPQPQLQPQPQQQTSGCTWIIIIALGICLGLVLLSYA
jgi:hypothetical protein